MSLYKVKIVEEEKVSENWGAFKYFKAFNILRRTRNNNRRTAKNIYGNISGFVVQYVKKQVDASVLCGDDKLKQIKNIENFTSQQVKYMNHSYTELFPVLNGQSVYADVFSNGPILRYEYDEDDKLWYADDNPPTSGQIIQEGIIYFISAPEEDVQRVIDLMENQNKNKNKNTEINIFGIKWDINKIFPTNGLPYSDSPSTMRLIGSKQSNMLHHMVVAKWDGIQIKINKNTRNQISNLSGCAQINQTRVPSKNIKTKISSKIIEI